MSKITLPRGIDAPGTLSAIDKLRCERSLHQFIRRAWRIVEPGQPFVDNWHIEFICAHLEAITDGHVLENGKPYNRLLINVPPGMMKSLIVNVFWPAWEWGPRNMPHMRFICAAHQQNLAVRDSTKMRRLVTSDWYSGHWGDRVILTGDQNAKTKFENTATGFREAIAAGSITGSRGDRVLCFPYDEIVHTEDGPQKIGDIVKFKSKAKVWSSLPGTGRIELSRVLDWRRNPASEIIKITLSDGSSFRCTPDHRIWTARGWVRAGLLSPSDAIPRQSVANSPDCSGRYVIDHGQSSLRASGCRNFKDILFGQLGPTGRFAAPIIIGLQSAFRKFFPSPSRTYLSDGSALDPESFSDSFGRGTAGGNDDRLIPCKDGPGSILMNKKSSVPLGVGDVLRTGSVFKIFQSGIRSVSVFVSDFFAGRWRSNKSQHDGLMHEYLRRNAVSAGVESRVSLSWGGSQYFSRDKKRSASFTGDGTGLAPNATQIAYAVEAIESDERFPVLIERAGHAEETFCLRVAGNHTFFVGSGKGVLVSNCDDPHSVEGANSDAMRQSTLEWFTEAVPTRLNNPKTSAIVVIMQRLHEEDVSGIILERKGFKGTYDHICLPMRYEAWRSDVATWLGYSDPREEEGELLFTDRFPEDVVDDIEAKLGPYATAGQHQQAPTPRGGGIIKDSWWQLWEEDAFPPMDYVIASLDTAYSTKAEERGDYSALSIWGVWSGNPTLKTTRSVDRYGRPHEPVTPGVVSSELDAVPRVMLMYAWAERLALHELVQKVIRDCTTMKADCILIENKAAGNSVAQEIRRLVSHEKFYLQMFDPKSVDKLGRLYSVQHLFAEGMIYAPDRKFAEEVIRQVSSFPRGKHDDLVDTVSQALIHLRKMGLLTRSAERLAEIDESKQFTGNRNEPLYAT